MRSSTACVLGAVDAGSAAFALGAANGGDGAALAAADSCTCETGDGYTCEEASDRGRYADVDQRSGKYFHTRGSRRPVNRGDLVVAEVLKVKNLNSSLNFSERAHAPGRVHSASMMGCNEEETGRQFTKVDSGTTNRDCSGSGETAKKSLSAREHGCPGCDPAPGRDANSTVTKLNRNRTALASQDPSLGEGLGAKLCEA